jgi:hypothetical protein
MLKQTVTSTLLTLGAAMFWAAGANAQGTVGPIELQFVTFTQEGLVEQEVFIEKTKGSGEVHRIANADVDKLKDAMLFGAAEEVAFDPLNPEPGGPYPMGEELGITLGDWIAAKGTASYSCDANKTTVKASFENLVPNGVYSVWNFIDADPPTDPYIGMFWPLGARDGSEAIFNTDAQGRASYEVSVEPCLDLSGNQTITGLAISWHSDGKTCGLSPCALGVVTFTQMFTMLPKLADVAGGQ